MAEIGVALRSAVDALSAVPRALEPYRALDDAALLDLTRVAADEVRLAQLHVSLLAGEIARRSAPELGHDGLAQRTGHRTPDELVRVTTGTRLTDARTAVRVGGAVSEPGPIGAAVLDGQLSVAVADAISTGLGVGRFSVAGAGVDASTLDEAAAQLIARIAGVDADRAGREARALRDEIDAEGIQHREAIQRDRRSLRMGRRADGTGFAHWVLDPETFAVVSEVYDRITSPRRGGPSFVADGERADRMLDDPRTTEQLASDTFAELLRQGAAADSSQLLGDGPIGVRILVTARAITERRGSAWFEGQADAVSVATAERLACAAGTVIVTVDGNLENAGQPLNLGRERRLFSRAQRVALAVRDGGCRWPGCERPPSWCEAHHIEHWQRDGGRTDVADGVLLCRHHHLLVHNNGWQISRAGPQYLLAPPGRESGGHGLVGGVGRVGGVGGVGEGGGVIDMPSRSRALAAALRSG